MGQPKGPRGGRGLAGLQGLAVAALILIGLAGCGTSDDQGPSPEQPCPRAVLLEGAARLSVPPEASDSPQALRYVAALSGIRSRCDYTAEEVEVDIGFNVIAERGPALQGDSINLSYFVATVGPDQSILSKQMFGAELEFPEGQQITGMIETMTVRLPVSSPAEGAAHALYVGFQLEQAELSPSPPLLR